MNYLSGYNSFIKEGVLADFTKNIEINFRIEADDHFFDRLSRFNNDPDESGSTIIDESEVIDDIKKSLRQIVNRNLFNFGIYWGYKSDKNRLSSDILIFNKKTNLNTVVFISKEKTKYIITVKTVMRKKNYKINSEKTISIEV
jgi:hypothetical protein